MSLINQSTIALRARIDEAVKDLHELTIKINHADLAKTVSDLRNRINDPFMFVIVGEVKAGKSSFINALLQTDREITKVAPQPMTDTIQQIVYGEKEEVIVINPFLKKILIPVDILKEVAIVDTPGTNTIIEHHQEITESFIPASDLIVFVFEAKNPYRQSAWDFFKFIHGDWRKKVIFVLQQKDLMSAEDLEVNMKGVLDYAEKQGIHQPQIFATSAKLEKDGNKAESGFIPIRHYILENITGGKAPVLKLENSVSTCLRINDSIREGLDLRQQQWEADMEFRKDIKNTLDNQELKSNRQVDQLVENILAGYDRTTQAKERELREGLSLFSLVRRSISSIFTKKTSAKEWLETLAKELEQSLNEALREKLHDGINDVADNVQQMAKLIDLKIHTSKSLLHSDHEIFSSIAERRHNIFRELQEKFEDFVKKSESFTDNSLFPDKAPLPGSFATGSGIAVIGLILAAITQGAVFDITGGVLTTIGILFAGFATSGKRRKIIEGFQQEIDRGRSKIETDVNAQLKQYIKRLKERIDSNFDPFDLMLAKEKEQLVVLNQEQGEVAGRFTVLNVDIKQLLSSL
ncbi:dynamin family protein [Haliscomenobacter hydrossis]|uniref:GTP-binding protein HSR1-related protein n=1 Tax=Haliscomenobacter hydrossis (strain ATCC 27775 / DSM 1100 / LMG 10767 / O) TaxID=760192 RepID=F4L2M4_HALH1|nr:dynamin family protein [Haliscomenobacter hydrossis]AEE53942.1 GTP-binding protein HSR1-related protein [Haliscomenobacter hydrossis DSM 1100]